MASTTGQLRPQGSPSKVRRTCRQCSTAASPQMLRERLPCGRPPPLSRNGTSQVEADPQPSWRSAPLVAAHIHLLTGSRMSERARIRYRTAQRDRAYASCRERQTLRHPGRNRLGNRRTPSAVLHSRTPSDAHEAQERRSETGIARPNVQTSVMCAETPAPRWLFETRLE